MKIKINWKTIAMLLLCFQNSLPLLHKQQSSNTWNATGTTETDTRNGL